MKLFIQQGRFRNRSLAIPPAIHGHLEFTPARIKEAAFQIVYARLGGRVHDCAFLDLCAGSGQMGLEALSRGYRQALLNELDPSRFRFLVKEVARFQPAAISLQRRSWTRLQKWILEAGPAVLFLDLPYTFWKNPETTNDLDRLLDTLLESGSRKILLVQAPLARIDTRRPLEVRHYGSHFLHIFDTDLKSSATATDAAAEL